MKLQGFILIAIGFTGAALTTVLDETQVNWIHFTGTMMLGCVGIVLVKKEQKKVSHEEGMISANIDDIEKSLAQIVSHTKRINKGQEISDPYLVHRQIDAFLPDLVHTFVNARMSIAHIYGLQNYANVMSYFAAGERYLNRVWSASVDGYIDEVRTYLDKAEKQFEAAVEQFRELKTMA